MTEPLVYEYKIRIWAMLFICAWLILFAAAFAFMAVVNTSGATAIITLSPADTTAFYRGISLFFVLSTAVAVRMVLHQRKQQKKIIITDSDISLPRRPLSNRTVTIPFDTIHKVCQVSNRGIAFISIQHDSGSIAIPESHLASRQVYDEIYALLSGRCGTEKQRAGRIAKQNSTGAKR